MRPGWQVADFVRTATTTAITRRGRAQGSRLRLLSRRAEELPPGRPASQWPEAHRQIRQRHCARRASQRLRRASVARPGVDLRQLPTCTIVLRASGHHKINIASVQALKPGNRLSGLDHAAEASGSGLRDTNTRHRIDEASVKAEVEMTGFGWPAKPDPAPARATPIDRDADAMNHDRTDTSSIPSSRMPKRRSGPGGGSPRKAANVPVVSAVTTRRPSSSIDQG